jgi:hypothetical protein
VTAWLFSHELGSWEIDNCCLCTDRRDGGQSVNPLPATVGMPVISPYEDQGGTRNAADEKLRHVRRFRNGAYQRLRYIKCEIGAPETVGARVATC